MELRLFLYTKDNTDVLCELNANVLSVAWFLLIVLIVSFLKCSTSSCANGKIKQK